MKRIFLLIALFIMSDGMSRPIIAQSVIKDAITVNGLRVGNRYTQEQFVQALGNPSKIILPDKFDEYTNAYTYYYGEDRFYWIDGEFYGFDLRSSKFAVNGLLRVGDLVSKVDTLEGVKEIRETDGTRLVDWRPSKGELYDWLSVRFYYDNSRNITYIIAFINDL